MMTAPTTGTRFEPARRERLRRLLLRRGATLAGLLAEILAGKDTISSLAALGVLRPGIRPEEALRKALDQVELRRRLLVAEDERFGRCDVCGVDLGNVVLDGMPWADRCQAHSTS